MARKRYSAAAIQAMKHQFAISHRQFDRQWAVLILNSFLTGGVYYISVLSCKWLFIRQD
jgi:hypothetical protein